MTRVLGCLLLLPVLAGCVEVEETLGLASDGSGTYRLRVVWDAPLQRRLVDVVGLEAARHFEGRPFPLTEGVWRETLAGLEGVELHRLAVDELEDGRRKLEANVRFERLEQLLAWELFARRGLVLRHGPARSDDPEGAPTSATLVMQPLARVPVLGPLAAAFARQAEDAGAQPASPELLDPEPLARWGVSRAAAGLAARILAPHLGQVTLTFRVRLPTPPTDVGAGGVRNGLDGVFPFAFADLGAARDRTIRVSWAPRAYHRVPSIDHAGDAPRPDSGARSTGSTSAASR